MPDDHPAEARPITPADIRFVKQVCATITHPACIDLDDIVGWGLLGLLEASRHYDDAVGTYRGYIAYLVRRRVQDGLRAQDHLTRAHRRAIARGDTEDPGPPLSLDHPLDADRYERLTVMDLIGSEERDLAAEITVRDALEVLSGRTGWVVRLRLADVTCNDIALILGVTESRVCQLYREGLRDLADLLDITPT